MKQIYIVLTNTGTFLSKIIRAYTHDEFSHVSISLSLDMQQMYSFGRLHAYNPSIGGFVHEYIDKGTFKRFYKTKTSIYYLNINDDQYSKLQNIICEFDKNKDKLKFNLNGLLAVGFNKKIKKENYFYCAEFVKYAFDRAGIKNNLPELTRPECFKDLDGITEIYSGLLKDYEIKKLENKEYLYI